MKLKKSEKTTKKVKKSKRFNEVSDPEYVSAMDTALFTEMTGAVPTPPISDFEEEAYEDIVSGANFYN